jgi:hypothetical protein
VDADVPSGPIFQLPHEFDQVALDYTGIVPLPLERCGCRDVLRDPVDERREWLDRTVRPESSPLVVAASAQDDRVLRCDDYGQVGIRRVVVGEEPVGEDSVGTLGETIEGQQFIYDDFACTQPRGHLATPSSVGSAHS